MGIFESACRHCGSKEHASEDCPHGILSTECRHCGSKNHASDDCPHGIFSEECRHCGSKDHATDDCPQGLFATPRREAPQAVGHDDSTGGDGLVQLIIGIAVVVFVIWFITSVAIPLVVINMASIALVAGVVKKNWSKVLFPVSFLGAIIVVADYNLGWATHVLSSNVTFFRSWIKPLLYINLFAGLTAAYLSIRHVLNTRTPPPVGASEFSKRNLIAIGCLLVVGVATIGVQQYVDTNASHLDIVPKSQDQSSPLVTEQVTNPAAQRRPNVRVTVNNNDCWPQDFYLNNQIVATVPAKMSREITVHAGHYAARACAAGTRNCGDPNSVTWTPGTTNHTLFPSPACVAQSAAAEREQAEQKARERQAQEQQAQEQQREIALQAKEREAKVRVQPSTQQATVPQIPPGYQVPAGYTYSYRPYAPEAVIVCDASGWRCYDLKAGQQSAPAEPSNGSAPAKQSEAERQGLLSRKIQACVNATGFRQAWNQYSRLPGVKALAILVAENGGCAAGYSYGPGPQSEANSRAVSACQNNGAQQGLYGPCVLYAEGYRIVLR